MKSETIAAISTPMSDGGIGIIRISGEDAFVVADRIYQSNIKYIFHFSLLHFYF